jgi:hypothetical protein
MRRSRKSLSCKGLLHDEIATSGCDLGCQQFHTPAVNAADVPGDSARARKLCGYTENPSKLRGKKPA